VKIQCNTCHQMASLASKLYKIQFRPGLRPGPSWGSLRRSPRPPSRFSSPHSLPPRRLRRLAVDALRISGYATETEQLLLHRVESYYGFTSRLTHNHSKTSVSSNQLHCYWHPKTKKHNNTMQLQVETQKNSLNEHTKFAVICHRPSVCRLVCL